MMGKKESRYKKDGNLRKPTMFLMNSMDIYHLIEEIKSDDVDVDPAAVTSVGEILVIIHATNICNLPHAASGVLLSGIMLTEMCLLCRHWCSQYRQGCRQGRQR